MMQLHATTIAVEGRAIVILGPSGSGKSTLGLDLMATGGLLVADDRTDLRLSAGRLVAQAPHPLLGRIEARGVGILEARVSPPAPVVLACDLGRAEDQRLPPHRRIEWLGIAVSLVLGPYRPHLHAALRQLLLARRVD